MSVDILHELLSEDRVTFPRALAAQALYQYALALCQVVGIEHQNLRAELWPRGKTSSRNCLLAAVQCLSFDGVSWRLTLDFAPKGPRWPFGSIWAEVEGERPKKLKSKKYPSKDKYKVSLYSWVWKDLETRAPYFRYRDLVYRSHTLFTDCYKADFNIISPTETEKIQVMSILQFGKGV